MKNFKSIFIFMIHTYPLFHGHKSHPVLPLK